MRFLEALHYRLNKIAEKLNDGDESKEILVATLPNLLEPYDRDLVMWSSLRGDTPKPDMVNVYKSLDTAIYHIVKAGKAVQIPGLGSFHLFLEYT